MDDRIVYAALALAVGLLVGAAGTAALSPQPGADAPKLGEDPTYWTASAGAHPASETPYENAGWLHEVQLDDRMVLTGNASVVHAPDERVALKVTAVGDDYVLRFETVPDDGPTKGAGPQVSRIQWGTSVAADYGTVELWTNGQRVRYIENDEATTPRLFFLPNPLNATN